MVFCNAIYDTDTLRENKVTILILVDGFLQYRECAEFILSEQSHNPYFSRWFSAIII